MADSNIEHHLDSEQASDSETKAHVALEISENKQLNTEMNLIGNLVQRDASGNKSKNSFNFSIRIFKGLYYSMLANNKKCSFFKDTNYSLQDVLYKPLK